METKKTKKITTPKKETKKVSAATALEAVMYSVDGKKAGVVALPEKVFGLPWNADLMYQTVLAMQANARTSVAHTKDRSEVSGGGKKPWQQKGTGRARHGSTRSPIWRHGGVTHGPRNDKDYSQKINKKVRTKALYIALSQKLKDGELLFVDTFAFGTPKTADAKKVVATLSKIEGFDTMLSKRKNSTLIVSGEKDDALARSFNNFGNIKVSEVRNLNPVEALRYKHIVIANPEKSIAFLEGKSAKKTTTT
jgi:large subunit ribosomal protein L4